MLVTASQCSVELQARDIALLRELFHSRVMTLAHAAVLFFDGSKEAAKKRVQKLKAAGLVGERPRSASEPSVLLLSQEGYSTLAQNGALDGLPRLTSAEFQKRSQVRPLTLQHELEVMDVKTAIVSALAGHPTYSVAEFSTWPKLYQFEVNHPRKGIVTVKPDGFLRVRERDEQGESYEHTFFLEVDRSTETLDTLATKAECYREYYRNGGLAVRLGGSAEQYKAFPFRVLVVCKTEERRDNVLERMLRIEPPILSMVWCVTLSEVTSNPLGTVWTCPADQRNLSDMTWPNDENKSTTLRGGRRLLQ